MHLIFFCLILTLNYSACQRFKTHCTNEQARSSIASAPYNI
jgi:hypothetical protein